MSKYVYKDAERKEVIFVDENASKIDKNTRFYCPDITCDAHMHICNVDGLSTAHFKAKYKKYPHKEGCEF